MRVTDLHKKITMGIEDKILQCLIFHKMHKVTKRKTVKMQVNRVFPFEDPKIIQLN